jgi:hypothetical protein
MHDPRVRVREALHDLVREDPIGWSAPTLEVFRNRLLDRTGSDYRPYADLIVEAVRRGWCQRLGHGRVAPAQWDRLLSPFVLQWTSERFVQAEMARWAAECWGVALGVLPVDRVQVAPPPSPAPARVAPPTAPGSPRGAAPGGLAKVGGGSPLGAGSPLRPGGRGAMPARPLGGAAPWRAAGGGSPRPIPRVPLAAAPSLGWGRSRTLAAPIHPRVPRLLAGAVAALLVAFGIQVARTPTAAVGDAPVPPELVSRGIAPPDADRRAATAPAIAPGAATGTVPSAALGDSAANAAGASPGRVASVAPPVSGGTAGASPGVPALTGALLPTAADQGRLLLVQPARRASGEGRRLLSPGPPSVAAAYDELHLHTGEVMRGTVEVVRAGTLLFRDRRTGLRHEVRKDSVDYVITEFGSTVRFRAGAPGPAERSAPARATRSPRAAASLSPRENGPRARGVAGRYAVRYAAAQVEGSAACGEAWRRGSGAVDLAEVRHEPGADTLVVAFAGGDTFPSTLDADGYFASTFRIVPDQARSSTALTTRLTGRFEPSGDLLVTVNLVFYRRLRTGEDLACTVAIPGRGTRQP